MTTPTYDHERWLYPVEIDSTNKSLVVDEDGGGAVVVDVAEGTYYVHAGTGGLLKAAVDALNASGSLSGTYSVEATTPSQTNSLGRCGVRLRVSGLSTSFSITLAGGGGVTAPNMAQCFGLGNDDAGGAFSGVADGADFIVDSLYSYAGSWIPYERRARLDPQPMAIAYGSSEYTERDDFYAMSYGTRTGRLAVYDYLPSTRIFDGRAKLFEYASNAEEAQGDINNALELMWERLRLGGSTNRVYVTVHDALDPLDLDAPVTSGASSDSDLLAPADFNAVQSLRNLATEMRTAGEFYRVELPMIIVQRGVIY